MEELVSKVPFPVVFILLVVGFVLLIKGADFFVDGSSSIAKRFNIPSVIIGLTVVAMGTSLPETSVSVTASLAGNNALAVSNAIGSNIFNLVLIIGICAAITPIDAKDGSIKKDMLLSGFFACALLGLGIIGFGDKKGMTLGHLDGAIMLGMFVAYLTYMVVRVVKNKKKSTVEVAAEGEEEIKIISLPLSILFIVGGALAIVFGGDLTVESASRIALNFGMSQTLVGLTIVSIGTSLPELVTSFVAAKKNEIGMALGNVVGSNIFNILMVLGIASAISPITFLQENVIDISILIASTILMLLVITIRKRVSRVAGWGFIMIYVGFTAYIIARNFM